MYGAPTPNRFFKSRGYIRSLRIKFIPEFLPADVRSGHILDCWSDPPFRLLSKKQRASAIHRYNRELCQAVWTNTGKVITQMTGLETLYLDIEQSFCPHGCCRMVGHVLRSLQAIRKKAGFTLRVSGELCLEESSMLLKGLSYYNDKSMFAPKLSKSWETDNESEEEEEEDDNDDVDDEEDEDESHGAYGSGIEEDDDEDDSEDEFIDESVDQD